MAIDAPWFVRNRQIYRDLEWEPLRDLLKGKAATTFEKAENHPFEELRNAQLASMERMRGEGIRMPELNYSDRRPQVLKDNSWKLAVKNGGFLVAAARQTKKKKSVRPSQVPHGDSGLLLDFDFLYVGFHLDTSRTNGNSRLGYGIPEKWRIFAGRRESMRANINTARRPDSGICNSQIHANLQIETVQQFVSKVHENFKTRVLNHPNPLIKDTFTQTIPNQRYLTPTSLMADPPGITRLKQVIPDISNLLEST
ncbi:hypothetical protein D910_12540 [Dendroctonus ponderosae]|uniref:Uncharacterized protein n=1 Tax=Dendroctonus ponderosae TaxID=77166 RepID=U4UMG4_DENPD|nr:hypothetical protein D910_12540 [Dendroctonus ponderosae]